MIFKFFKQKSTLGTCYEITLKLEQLEHLHSEIPSASPWLLILVIRIRPAVEIRQSQSYKF